MVAIAARRIEIERRVGRVPIVLAALPALVLARTLVPTHGAGIAVRLAAATACLLIPGALISRALRRPSVAATFAWSLVVVFVALVLTFSFHRGLGSTLLLMAAAGIAAFPLLARPDRGDRWDWVTLGVAGGGIALGAALWHVAPNLAGDGLFHVARVRKLDAFPALSLHTVDEFRDGGLHPGYAFPLWHGFLALVARLAGLDAGVVVLHESTVLAPLAALLAYEAGRALFDSRAAGVATAIAAVAAAAIVPGHGGAYRTLSLPSSAGRQLLAVAALALLFRAIAEPSITGFLTVGAASLALALVHPTYAIFILIPAAGFAVVRALLARRDVVPLAAGIAALAIPTAIVSLWLLPLARQTVSHEPTPATRLGASHGVAAYPRQLEVLSPNRFRLAPGTVDRAGALAVAALALVPLALLAARRRWAAFVLGGCVSLLAVLLVPVLFVHLADAVSLSQARRAAGFLPFAFAIAGGAAVGARLLRYALLPVAAVAGIALENAYPGDFGYTLHHAGPPGVAWFALLAGAGAIALGALATLLFKRFGRIDGSGVIAAAAVALLVAPAVVRGFGDWSRFPVEKRLPVGFRTVLRDLPHGTVVFSDTNTSYRIAAVAPVYIAAAPPGHVADTKANRPYERQRDVGRFMTTGDLAIPRRYRADWIVVDRHRFGLKLALPRAYDDGRFVLYRFAGVKTSTTPSQQAPR